jgi:hypothetical protein
MWQVSGVLEGRVTMHGAGWAVRARAATIVWLSLLAACARSPKDVFGPDAAPPVAPPPGATGGAPSPPGLVTFPGTIGRPKAESIALEYARKRWPQYGPNIATAFIQRDGSFHVVVGFVKRPDAASVYIRSTDGEVMDASIASP